MRPFQLLDIWVASACSNATLVVLVSGHSDVPILTPRRSPAVFHNPEVLFVLTAITHNQNSVVQPLRTALWLVVDTSSVQLKAKVAGINRDTDWAHGSDSFFQRLLVSGSDVGESSISGTYVFFPVSTCKIEGRNI